MKNMNFRNEIEKLYRHAIDEFTACSDFKALEAGTAGKSDYDGFIMNVVRTHLRSPQLLAFLFSVSPPRAYSNLLHNMLEELGIDEDSSVSHPALLRELADGAGLGSLLPEVEERAAADVRQLVVDPLLYPSLREVGLAAMVEIEAFEYMLSRVASRIARALVAHRNLSAETVRWFTYHSEVDIAHAEQGLGNLEAFIAYYNIEADQALTIAEIAMRENVFIKRYCGEAALGRVVERITL
jgi:pyrroloquinoline quinone (PQQ) biosynthesis protein C